MQFLRLTNDITPTQFHFPFAVRYFNENIAHNCLSLSLKELDKLAVTLFNTESTSSTSTSSLLLLELWPNGCIGPTPQSKRRTAFTQPPQPPPLPPRAFCGGIVLGSATGTSAGSRSPTVGCALPDTALGLKPQLMVPGQCRSPAGV